MVIQKAVDRMHERFVAAVMLGRRCTFGQAQRMADGRAHVAQEALELRLIDRVGSRVDAIRLALELAGARGAPGAAHAQRTGVTP